MGGFRRDCWVVVAVVVVDFVVVAVVVVGAAVVSLFVGLVVGHMFGQFSQIFFGNGRCLGRR